MKKQFPDFLKRVSLGLCAAALIWFERRRPLRPERQNKLRRDLRNLLIAAPAGAVMQALEAPVAFTLANGGRARGWGLLPRLSLPAPADSIAGILLLDYTLYWWHFLTHRVPLLWRFHQVHHLDQEMDATTALRFHFGEIAISVLFRAAQVAVIGPSAQMVAAWQLFLFVCILFHHSNLRLPLPLERTLARVLITPRLHGIHHSVAPEQVNSNWSSGLSVWDWLHATLRTEPPQRDIVIGLPGFLKEEQATLGKSLAFPFRQPGVVPAYDHLPLRQPYDALS